MFSFFRNKANLVYLHDILVTAICFNLSIFLRLGTEFNSLPNTLIIYGTALITVLGAIVYRTTGLYKGIWRYASINDLIKTLSATSSEPSPDEETARSNQSDSRIHYEKKLQRLIRL